MSSRLVPTAPLAPVSSSNANRVVAAGGAGAAASAVTATSTAPTVAAAADPLPSAVALLQTAKLSIKEDKPVQFDYFLDTFNGKAFLGEDKETKAKMLVKSAVEYTSHVQKMFKVDTCFIVMTENSIYVVSDKTQKKIIESNSLRGDDSGEEA